MKFKFKKVLIAMPIATMGAGLLATVLTSCGSSSIDAEKKVTLNDEGKLTDTYTFKDAVKMALTRSTNWATFKQAFADEIIYKWYTDRMYQNNDQSKGKNKTFSSNIDQWNYQINKDYDSLVQSEKTKYGTNYNFYLQNEYLSQYGGSEAAYKHAKLVEKVKSEFTSNVFKFNYFSYNTESTTSTLADQYPQIFTKNATTTVSRDELNKPATWAKLGFFASTNPTYVYKNWPETETAIDQNFLDFLSKNPDGDYATIQDYVFNRYFKTEKPFFSSAALFKYSNPKAIDGVEKISAIYDASATEVKLPDNPDESFPFFGGAKISDASKGTRMFMEWFNAFNKGEFATQYTKADSSKSLSNGTVLIPNEGTDKYSEDSQTLLLCSATQMIGGSESLYIPYSTVAAQMYGKMMLETPVANERMNKSSQSYLATTVPTSVFEAIENNPAIFKNFFFDPTQYGIFTNTSTHAGDALNSYINLARIYPEGIVSGDGSEGSPYEYHCPLFKKVSSYPYFYGNANAEEGKTQIGDKYFSNKSGVVLVSNTMYIDSLTPTTAGINGQPWALQLNTSGMHAQTIDGYDFVQRYTDYGSSAANKSEALKEVFKYRLMQQRCGQIKGISGELLGASGKLKTYFTNNFANIILEMALSTNNSINIFKEINKFKETPADANMFFKKLCDEEKFVSAEVKAYVEATNDYDDKKKIVDAIDTANKAIYEYRSKQVTNAKSTSSMKTIYTNGLLAPLPIQYTSTDNLTRYNYTPCNFIHYLDISAAPTLPATAPTKAELGTDLTAIQNLDLIKNIDSVVINKTDNGFSPQVASAKNAMSNRYWYRSAIVDKVMYSFNGNKDGIANAIKYDTYEKYATDKIAADTELKDVWSNMLNTNAFKNAITTTYEKSKTLTGNITYADLDPVPATSGKTFYQSVNTWFNNSLTEKINMAGLNGNKTADDALAKRLFESTLVYLSINNFENLYKTLNSKIGENEVALVGYMNKFNPWSSDETTYKKGSQSVSDVKTRYGWSADVDNIYDQDGYLGGVVSASHTDSPAASSTYWNVVNKTMTDTAGTTTSTLAGFTGLQSRTSNNLDSASGLQDAVFNNFPLSTQKSVDVTTGEAYKENAGSWFAFSGNKETNGNEITFDDVTYEDSTTHEKKTIKASQFKGQDGVAGTEITKQVLRLAKKIANYDSIDDLKTLSKSLADSYDGSSLFHMIGYGEVFYQDTNQMRYDMLNVLPHFNLKADGTLDTYVAGSFEDCFRRVKNIEPHTTTKIASNQNYSFDDKKGNGYHLFFTQINKADITEKRLTPKFESGAWVQDESSPITPEEFLYILCATALESSVQSLTTTQSIKLVYGDAKLNVYDANLYNTFDSSWIKDWVKKPIGK